MKKFVKLLFLVAAISLVAGCNKTDEFFEDTQPELKKAKLKVMPSTSTDVLVKAEEDWNNINDALQNAGSGDVVQLGEGLFYLHKSIIRWDFNGTLRGSGMGKTIIRTAPNMTFNIDECPPVNWSFEDNSGAFLLCFAHNYFENKRTVSVSDLSVVVDEPTPTRPKGNGEINSMHAIMVMYTNLDNKRDKPVNLNISYKNISVKGKQDFNKYKYKGYSVFSGLSGYGYSNGIFEVKNAFIENTSGCIKPHAFFGPDATIIIKNCCLKNSTHGVYAFFDHSWTILNNKIENCEMGLALLKRVAPAITWDGPVGKTYVKDNLIESFSKMGIGLQFTSNVQIKDNVVTGSGMYGGIASIQGSNWIVKDNNLCGVSAPTIFLMNLKNSEIKNNFNQVIFGPGAAEPTNIIGEGVECDD